jgi:hypothetical protein
MNTRSTILSLTALATLSLSALASGQASAWESHGGGGGYGRTGGDFVGHHHWDYGHGGREFEGHRWYGRGGSEYVGHRHDWRGYRFGGYGRETYRGGEEGCGCETEYLPPPPPVESCGCEAPRPIIKKVYVPVEVPVEVRVPVRVEVPVPVRVEVPVPYRVPVPVHEEACGCEAPEAYVPPPVEEPCNCETPTERPYYAPPARSSGQSMPPRREYFRDSAQTMLERD